MVKAIIVASGVGSRMGSNTTHKQFLIVKNKPLLVYSLETFQNDSQIDEIVIVTNDSYISLVESWVQEYKLEKVVAVVEGGNTRRDSVFNGLKYLKDHKTSDDDIVLIHDAARPLVSQRIINDNITCCMQYHACSTVIPSIDTLFNSKDGNEITSIPNRGEYYNAQTPQTFKFDVIYSSHINGQKNSEMQVTDDCGLVIANGYKIHLVEGERMNFKVTTKEDLILLNAFLNKDI